MIKKKFVRRLAWAEQAMNELTAASDFASADLEDALGELEELVPLLDEEPQYRF